MRNHKGFTLIELLIVVVIIGILAAIAIPKFAATKDKAKLASVKTDLRNIMTAEEAYFSDNATYGTAAVLNTAKLINFSTGNAVGPTDQGSATGYTVSVKNASISDGNNTCTVYGGKDATDANKTDGVIECSKT
jgi:prepilin-type N-terminal cleavage/methylation domain-containing protein